VRVNCQALQLETVQRDYQLRLRLGNAFELHGHRGRDRNGVLTLVLPKRAARERAAPSARRRSLEKNFVPAASGPREWRACFLKTRVATQATAAAGINSARVCALFEFTPEWRTESERHDQHYRNITIFVSVAGPPRVDRDGSVSVLRPGPDCCRSIRRSPDSRGKRQTCPHAMSGHAERAGFRHISLVKPSMLGPEVAHARARTR